MINSDWLFIISASIFVFSIRLSCFCFLDDVISDKVAMLWNKQLNAFFVQGRHLAITVAITTQHTKGVGPLIRKNLDMVVIQPTFDADSRDDLRRMYGGFIKPHDAFFTFMDEVVMDENLPGSTPQEPKKEVRTLVIREFENTPNPQVKYSWWKAEDPGEFRMLKKEYWKEQENDLDSVRTKSNAPKFDPCEELDNISSLYKLRY